MFLLIRAVTLFNVPFNSGCDILWTLLNKCLALLNQCLALFNVPFNSECDILWSLLTFWRLNYFFNFSTTCI